MTCHYGLAKEGELGLCGSSDGVRRTSMWLIDCPYCQNTIDLAINRIAVFNAGEKPVLKVLMILVRLHEGADWVLAEPHGEPKADGSIVATVCGYAGSNTFKIGNWKKPW